jgi:hypothetical protein
LIACSAVILALGACSRTFHVSIPGEHLAHPPLVARLPLAIGVAYASNVPGYRHVAEHQDLAGRVTWRVELGEASVVMFDQVFASMFERVVSMRSSVEASRELDGVLEVAIQEVKFDWTVPSSPVPIRVSIMYGITLRAPGADETIASWAVTGTGVSSDTFISGWERVRRISMAAVRAAAARFMVDFTVPVNVQEWLKAQKLSLGIRDGER